MPEALSLRIAIRFPRATSAQWQQRCVTSLRAAAERIEITAFTGLTPSTPDVPTDLVVDLSSETLDKKQRNLQPPNPPPRMGYWSLAYGEEPELTAPGLQEFLKGGRAAYVRLIRLNLSDAAEVLREGAVKAVLHSLEATRARLLDAIVDWPGNVLKTLLRKANGNALPTVRLRRRGAAGRAFQSALLPAAWMRNVIIRVTQEITREHWAVGVIAKPVEQVWQSFDAASIHWLQPPADGFLADPFGLTRPDGTLVVLAEALSWQEGRGRIVAFELRPDGKQTALRDVFSFTSHASYPHFFAHDGAIYCIPETSAQRRVQLFRADPFPDRWVPDTVLLENFAGADATVCLHDGRWWLFVGNHDDQDETKLFVFHAADLRGPWLPHASNPVKCDLRSSRPAGPFFTVDGTLYRPAQNCAVTYGGGVVVNRIERLTPEEFVEQTVRHIDPATRGPYPHGLHTLSGAGNVTLVDGKRHAVSFAALTVRLKRLLEN